MNRSYLSDKAKKDLKNEIENYMELQNLICDICGHPVELLFSIELNSLYVFCYGMCMRSFFPDEYY